MDLSTIEKIRSELEQKLVGQKFGRIFTLSRFAIAVDFRLHESSFLFISIEPANPRIYLINRRLRDLEKSSGNPSPFGLGLRKRLANAVLLSIEGVPDERALKFNFSGEDDLGEPNFYSLLVQLTGRSANIFLLDKLGYIVDASRESESDGQQIGERYIPPFRDSPKIERSNLEEISPASGMSISEHLDVLYLEKAAENGFKSLANSARSKLKQERSKRERLVKKLNQDLAGHGNAERWKRFGDLLLANAATAKREADIVFVTDYYDENVPTVEIEADANDSITTAAEKYFRKYTKARNAAGEIAKRLSVVADEIAALAAKEKLVEEAIDVKDQDMLAEITSDQSRKPTEKARGKKPDANPGSRSFVSSDGFEILVGKKAKDNDFLTFRIAKSLDLWMHAADYPGSHVIIRNPNRKEIPNKTLLEAAELAAFYSDARTQLKAAVNYTPKKFVNKPKGSAPGLVSLSNFKTILVVPGVPETVAAS